MTCQSVCRNKQQEETPTSVCTDDYCAPAPATPCADKNVESTWAGDKAEACSSDRKTAYSNAKTKKGNRCAEEEANATGVKKKDSGCAKNDVASRKVDETDSCSSKKKTSCAETKKKDSCFSPKKDATANTKKKQACRTVEDDKCCADTNARCDSSLSSKSGSYTSSFRGPKRLRASTEACSDHLQKAFDEYTGYLEKGLCICCSVLNRLDKCCGNPIPTLSGPGSTPRGASTSIAAPQQPTYRHSAKHACKNACCDEKPPSTKFSEIQESSECTVSNLGIKVSNSRKAPVTRAKDADIETDAAREHVVLRVSGMTCTGCSRKVTNVLNNVDGVSSVKVTFVTGIADFNLDSTIFKVEQVIQRIEKETGFKYSRIVGTYQALDLRINPARAKDACAELEDLVESVEKLDKTTYRVNYDPAIIGARTLLSSVRGIELAPPGTDATLADGRKRLINMAWSAGLAAVLTIPIVVLAWSDNPVSYSTRSIVSLILATFVQAIAVPEFSVGAIKSLVYSRVLEMDMLIVISITAAYGYSVIAFSLTRAGYVLETGEFFETSSLLITLVLLGRLVAAIAKVRAVSAVSLRSLQAEKALLFDLSGDTTEIDARLLQFGDVFIVPAHAGIVTDGEVLRGQSTVDESMLTGESVPVPKGPGDAVTAGTLNGPTALTVRMTRLPGKNSITDIANLVENALASKPRIQDLPDKVASYFVPIVITLSLIAFGIWMAVAMKVRGENGGGAVGIAITYGIAVLAVSCPCVLGLAVPMVLVIAGGVAAKAGVIIKQADAIERGYKVTDVVFDKTGTLTKGDLTVVHSEVFGHLQISANGIFALTKALTKDNIHPVSLAVAAQDDVSSSNAIEVDNVESLPGAGVQCIWRGSVAKAGNPYWLKIEDRPEIAELINRGMTLLCVTLDSIPVAAFGLKSAIRDEASAVVKQLHHYNIKCHIVSGDGPRVVEDIAQAVGIPVSNIASPRKPAEKQEYVKALMSSGRVVLFCGDGTNDAVAVAQANVGVQIGAASDVTRATADVVLLGGLDGVPALLELSKRSFRRIAFNFVWSAIYNVFAILLAGGAFVKVRIPPAYAGLGEIVSVSPVIAAAVSLAWQKRGN